MQLWTDEGSLSVDVLPQTGNPNWPRSFTDASSFLSHAQPFSNRTFLVLA